MTMLSLCQKGILGVRLQHKTGCGNWRHIQQTSRCLSSAPSKATPTSDKSFLESVWVPIVGGFVIATVGGIRYVHDHVGGTEGLVRSASFYSLAIPKYVEYRWHQWRQSPDHVWEDLDSRTSAVGLEKLRELKGFYIKCGQVNSFPYLVFVL